MFYFFWSILHIVVKKYLKYEDEYLWNILLVMMDFHCFIICHMGLAHAALQPHLTHDPLRAVVRHHSCQLIDEHVTAVVLPVTCFLGR